MLNIKRFLRDERGSTAMEYGLIAAMIAVGTILAFQTLGGGVLNLFGSSSSGAGGAMEDAAVIVGS